MKDIRIVFMGTPVFCLPILTELIANTDVVLVVTAPDALVGRKKVLTPSPVKNLAVNYKIEVFAPEKIRTDYKRIQEIKPDLIITCAYGQIIPKEVLEIPSLGCVNIHPSLLPKYRGGAPIHHAIMNGETQTGVTLIYMDEGMDSGDIITQKTTPIENHEMFDDLSNKLAILSSKMIIEHLPSIIDGSCPRVKQNAEEATFAPIIKRTDEHLDFNRTKEEVYNQIRALTPNPYPYFLLNELEYKVIEATKVNETGKPGTIIEVGKDYFIIGTKNGGIKITKIKPFGKTIMDVSDYFNGFKKESLLGKEVK